MFCKFFSRKSKSHALVCCFTKRKVLCNRYFIPMNAPFRHNRKGYLYTLEVLVAVSIMLTTIVFLFRSLPQKPEIELSLIRKQGFEALEYLDNKGDLKNLTFGGNESVIESSLRSILEKNIELEIEICKITCEELNIPSRETIVLINYYISGYRDTYDAKKLQLYLWRKY